MSCRVARWGLVALALALAGFRGWPASANALQRLPNTSLQMPAQPPVFGYAVSNAFAGAAFTGPIGLATPPGETNRLFVLERAGRVCVITNLAAPNRHVFMNIASRVVTDGENGLLGIAFHPDYAVNRYFYLFYSTTITSKLHQVVARFQTSAVDPQSAPTNTEVRLIIQPDDASNHNGGDLHFGPDGYLYIAVGDEGGANDNWNNSQRIDRDFFSGILRIDVDQLPGSLPPNPHPAATGDYAVPADNPFVGATSFNGQAVNPNNVRTEFWAVGLRNPWRMSFDPLTGDLYCGDVGQNAWEEISVITKGGNYGWAYREGNHPGPKAPTAGFTSIPPIQEYPHGNGTYQGNVVIGGIVSRGNNLSQLSGAYVFCDGLSRHVWALRYSVSGSVTNFQPMQWLLTLPAGYVAGLGRDPSNGDVLFADLGANQLRRLVYSGTFTGQPLPPTLADTGAFSDLAGLTPAAGIVPYDLNVPFWSDHALKTRWFSVPDTNQTIGFSAAGNWTLPAGTVWVKHFELELTNGSAASRQRLETRLLVRTTNSVYGVTYRWGTNTANAALVPEAGLDETFVVVDGGTVRTQVWRYPARSECLTCHTPAGGHALGFNTPQLHRPFDYGGGPEDQLLALSGAGYFSQPLTSTRSLRALAPATDTAASREYRVRSYLAANCVQCHQPGGSGQALWDARIATPTSGAGLINGPLNDDLGDPANRVLAPGQPLRSMILTRLGTNGTLRMPPLASTVPDSNAIALITDWVTLDLPAWQSFPEWQIAFFGSTGNPAAAAGADPDGDGDPNHLEYLAGTDPTDRGSSWPHSIVASNGAVHLQFERVANRITEAQTTIDLADPGAWIFLDVPGNSPAVPAASSIDTLLGLTGTNDPQRFYRFHLREP